MYVVDAALLSHQAGGAGAVANAPSFSNLG